MFIYLAVIAQAASSVLLRDDGYTHQPIYFFIHALKETELNYTTQEKLALAVVFTARELSPYFYITSHHCDHQQRFRENRLSTGCFGKTC